MNCFKGKMALKMGGWVGVYFPLHKGVIKQKMLLKLVHFWKAKMQRLLADSAFYTGLFFPRNFAAFFAAWAGHSGFVGIQKNDLTTGPYRKRPPLWMGFLQNMIS